MLHEIPLKQIYDSENDNLLEDFYIPALKNSIKYKRITGYFSSTSLLIAAKGIAYFFANDGLYQLITGIEISQDDYSAIINGIKKAENVIQKQINFDAVSIEEGIIKDHLRSLAWLIAHNRLSIKIALIPEGNPGIFHEKIGIFEDKIGNKISFSGSINESLSGWLNNIEEFKVFRSWNTNEKVYLERDINKFEKYWSNQTNNFQVVDIPDAIKNNLLKIKPTDQEIKIIIDRIKNYSIKDYKVVKRSLYDYQKEAIKRWVGNNFVGILEMATGSGKTITSLAAVKEIFKLKNEYFVIIVVPYAHLINQWLKDVKLELDNISVIEAHGSARGWRKKLNDCLNDYNDGFLNKIILLTLYDTFSSQDFLNILLTRLNQNKAYMIIADEVHNFGAVQSRQAMIEEIQIRLGLSATPIRPFDEKGTDKIFNYFSKTVFKYDLKDAIRSGHLTPYNYFPHFVSMTRDEFNKYAELTRKILKNINKRKESQEFDYLKLMMIRRSKILKNCMEKINIFSNLINRLKTENNIDHLLVYCDSTEQLEMAQKIINQYGIINHKFTENESLEERDRILAEFDKGTYNCLVAMKCLDEGVNVPSTKTAIILASSTSPREHIQRRGRVLRKYPGKKFAVIHDFIVLPPELIQDPLLRTVEQNIIKKELNRTQEFLDSASNKAQIMTTISDVMLKYHVYLD